MSERARSHWGWGWADKFPSADMRRSLGQQIETLLGFRPTGIADPVRIEDIAVREPTIAPPPALSAICASDSAARITHAVGRSYRDLVRGFRGDIGGAAPDLVATPRTEDEVVAVLDWASSAEVAVMIYGGGTTVVGGVEAPPEALSDRRGVVSLDTRALEGVVEVDSVSRAARIRAGTLGPRIDAALAPHGLSLRHFPQSYEFSTLGGWIATRSGGHFATLYTHIDDVVESTRMITPAGVLESRRLPASGAGPSSDRLVLGSEGVLGVVTEAWVRVHARPRFRSSASVHFGRYEDAVAAAREISQAGLYPSNLRLLDSREAALNLVATDGTNVLLVAFESADHELEPWIARAIEICRDRGGTTPAGVAHRREGDAAPADAAQGWKSAFVEAPYLQNVLVSLGIIADTFETACTWDRFEALHAAIVENVRAAMKRVCGAGRISCRFTHAYPDGPAPYYTFLAPGRPGAELEQWAEIKQAACDTLASHGATITHHHAVGRTHKPWYERERPELFARALRAAKRELDPSGVLNPGVLL